MPKRTESQWPGPNDDIIIEAMLNDRHSLHAYHWNECQAYVNKLVQRTSNFSVDEKEEIAQNTMFWIVRYLGNFKRECRFTTWIIKVVSSRIADAGREKQTLIKRVALPPNDPDVDTQKDDYISRISSPRTAEEEYILHEDLREVSKALLDYLRTRANSERNIRILEMYLAGFSQEEI